MRQFNIIKIITVSLCICLLVGCQSSIVQGFDKQYLTITFTHVTDKDAVFEINTYSYDFNKNKINLISKIPYDSQYPLTYYDMNENKVYYSKKVQNKGDEMFFYDCKTRKIKQLTSELYAINYIVKIKENKLLLTAASDEGLLQLYLFDLENQKLQRIFMEDYMVTTQSYNLKSNSVLISGYQNSKETKLRDEYNSGIIDHYEVEYIIYEYFFETGERKELFKESNIEIQSMVNNNDYIYYKGFNKESLETSVLRYNIKSKEKTEIKQLKNIYQLVGLSDNSKMIIFISNEERGKSSLKAMNIDTNEITDIFTPSIEGQINNGFLVNINS